jgi:lipopolysaccharide transport system ATP-binding protein
MSDVVLKVENLSKQYRLGEIGTGTISHDLNRWWARIRGKDDPFSKIGQVNDRTKKAESDFVWALKDINFEVKKGEVLGIIGKNGAGKSTLLKLISRITAPTTGFVKAKGRIASLLEVGTGMHPEMTARENIYLNGAIMGMTKKEIKRKFDEIIDFAGCTMYVDTPVKRFSSGMRVRLGFAVAAFLEPEILIVDEVLAVGDAEFQKKAVGKMKDVSAGDGRTVLFVSHNMESVKHLCTKGVLLENGTSIFSGTAMDTVNYYKQSITSKSNVSNPHLKEVGNDKIQILNVFTQTLNGESIISVDSGLKVVCDIDLKGENILLTYGIKVRSIEGILLFETGFYLDESMEYTAQGKYRLISKIPGHILNAGIYDISIIFGHNMRDLVFAKHNILMFEVENTPYSGSIYRKLPGVIRPNIGFEVETIY